jgi:malate dehydrogenase (oxaloacetate-decarboxylating)(NADP+)
MNACELVDKKIKDLKIVVNGAGAAGIACIDLINSYGADKKNFIMVDSKGVIYKGRKENMNELKEAHAADTDARTLEDALKDADLFIGVSAKDALS